MPRRCFCGRSAELPLCDGSHQAAGWRCRVDAPVPVCFVATGHLESLAERLAHEHAGLALPRAPERVTAELVVVLSDGTDAEGLSRALERVQAPRSVVLSIGVPPTAACLRGREHVVLADEDALGVARQASACVERLRSGAPAPGASLAPSGSAARPLPRMFVSHAVLDEPSLAPAIHHLRAFHDASIFLCADTLRPGDDWRRSIDAALREAELFLLVLSKASLKSTYCAFEAGQARALGKRIAVVVFEPVPIPRYVEHLAALDLERLLLRKPWLDVTEALVESIVTVAATS
jgi:hypothetical protein